MHKYTNIKMSNTFPDFDMLPEVSNLANIPKVKFWPNLVHMDILTRMKVSTGSQAGGKSGRDHIRSLANRGE